MIEPHLDPAFKAKLDKTNRESTKGTATLSVKEALKLQAV